MKNLRLLNDVVAFSANFASVSPDSREAGEKSKSGRSSIHGHRVQIRRRPRRATIGINLTVDGQITVAAPHSVTREVIRVFLKKNIAWMEEKLARYSEMRATHPPKSYVEDEAFPLLGRTRTLTYVCGPRKSVRFEDSRVVVQLPPATLRGWSKSEAHPEMADLMRRYYKEYAKKFLDERMRHCMARTQLAPMSVRYAAQKTRWGSCSKNRRISLNWRLIVAPVEVIDYVIYHELIHLRAYEHTVEFWRQVAVHAPDYLACEEWLAEHRFDGDFLAERSELHGEL